MKTNPYDHGCGMTHCYSDEEKRGHGCSFERKGHGISKELHQRALENASVARVRKHLTSLGKAKRTPDGKMLPASRKRMQASNTVWDHLSKRSPPKLTAAQKTAAQGPKGKAYKAKKIAAPAYRGGKLGELRTWQSTVAATSTGTTTGVG